jgi:hypothetical protein
MAAATIAALLLAAAAPQASAVAEQATAIADAMETGFRACAQQIARPGYLAAPNTAVLAAVRLAIEPAAPPPVLAIANEQPELKAAPIFVRLAGPTPAQVWIIASPDQPICKVTVADSPDILGARIALQRKFMADGAWTYERAKSGTANGLMRQVFALDAARPGAHMLLLIDGPNSVNNDGAGIQAILTIGVVNPEAKQ